MTEKRIPAVLLVDDDNIILECLRGLFEPVARQVLLSQNGDDALEILDAKHAEIGLLVTDFKMPGMDGFQLARLAHQRYPELRIVCISSYFEDGHPVSGAPAYVSTNCKPVNARDLAAMLKQVTPGCASVAD